MIVHDEELRVKMGLPGVCYMCHSDRKKRPYALVFRTRERVSGVRELCGDCAATAGQQGHEVCQLIDLNANKAQNSGAGACRR